jgi:hypothetical protein
MRIDDAGPQPLPAVGAEILFVLGNGVIAETAAILPEQLPEAFEKIRGCLPNLFHREDYKNL